MKQTQTLLSADHLKAQDLAASGGETVSQALNEYLISEVTLDLNRK